MTLIRNEEQMLKSSANVFIKEKTPMGLLRKLSNVQEDIDYDIHIGQGTTEINWAS
jgi:hypothetical protein|tara:strand:- start:2300 stop:2467 length:168 start_codon:yes stop_codon:yes gene_type:complete